MPPTVREKAAVGVLCVLAGIRVFLYSAAFPMFNNVDEHFHFDTVWKCSRGRLPRGIEPCSPEAVRLMALYSTPEYFRAPAAGGADAYPPPPWAAPFDEERKARVERLAHDLQSSANHEGIQPPVYFVIAGAWYRLGEALGLRGASVLYWIRFLNIPLEMLLVYLAHRFATSVYPRRRALHLGAPLLVAGFPQSAFYSISNCALSPLIAGAAVLALFHVHEKERPSRAAFALAGAAAACAFLTMYLNAPILLVLAAVVLGRLRRAHGRGSLREELPNAIVLVLVAGAGVSAWLGRNYLIFGALTAFHQYADYWGWVPRPPGRIWEHPIFTPHGIGEFWTQLVATYFRGELVWHGAGLRSAGIDLVYVGSAAAFVLAAIVFAVGRGEDGRERYADRVCLFLFLGSVLLLAALSVRFEYRDWKYAPSRDHPYVFAGRLMLGTLVPFVMSYLTGLDWILTKTRLRLPRLVVAGVLALTMVVSEALLSAPVFGSKYNWFHLP